MSTVCIVYTQVNLYVCKCEDYDNSFFIGMFCDPIFVFVNYCLIKRAGGIFLASDCNKLSMRDGRKVLSLS